MIQVHTVGLRSITTTDDGIGNSTETLSTSSVGGLLYAPEGIAETTDLERPRVIGDATLYGTLTTRLNADDELTHDGECCDGTDFPHGTWQVVGGSKGWGDGDSAIPIRRTGAA